MHASQPLLYCDDAHYDHDSHDDVHDYAPLQMGPHQYLQGEVSYSSKGLCEVDSWKCVAKEPAAVRLKELNLAYADAGLLDQIEIFANSQPDVVSLLS